MSHQIRATPRRDEGEGDIIAALEAAGCTVKKQGSKGMPDLVVLVPARGERAAFVAMLEVKGAKAKLRPEQQRFFDLCRGKSLPIHVCRSPAEALELLGVEP